MSSSTNVLLFGRDEMLQQTRSQILMRDGMRVDGVATLSQLKSCLAAKSYGLLVLCHSLPLAEKVAGISIAASFMPEVRLLILKNYLVADIDYPFGQVLHVGSSPEGLLTAVRSAINDGTTPPRSQMRKVIMAQFQGTVKWFNNAKGYGFLGRDDGGADVFAHFSSIQSDGYRTLKEGDPVAYDVIQGDKGPQADQVRVLKKG